MPSAATARSKTKPAAKKKTPAKPAAAHVASPPAAPAAVKATSSANAIADKTQSLQTFDLLELAQYTPENSSANNASKDFHLFYVGRDDVHDILKHVLSRVRVSLYLNMFGYDDDELNQIIMQKVMDPSVTVLITLDKSQSNGVHEKNLIALDQQKGWPSSTAISWSAPRRRTRSAIPKVSWPTVALAAKVPPTGPTPEKARS